MNSHNPIILVKIDWLDIINITCTGTCIVFSHVTSSNCSGTFLLPHPLWIQILNSQHIAIHWVKCKTISKKKLVFFLIQNLNKLLTLPCVITDHSTSTFVVTVVLTQLFDFIISTQWYFTVQLLASYEAIAVAAWVVYTHSIEHAIMYMYIDW
jgi:hypothetical protein